MTDFEPTVRDIICPPQKPPFQVTSSLQLTPHIPSNSCTFLDILESRCSRRVLGKLSFDKLGEFLYLSCRTKQRYKSHQGLTIEKRNSPSAGALHSIECVISGPDENRWFAYNSVKHSLDEIEVENMEKLLRYKKECFNLLDGPQEGHLIWYVCNFSKLSAKYTNCHSLAYRDSGALSGTHSLVAEFLGLPFCILGKSGYEEAQYLSNQCNLMGAGIAILGGNIPLR